MTRDEMTRIVEDELRGLLGPRPVSIKGTDHLTHDLRIDSDDLSFLFCPNVQRRCGVQLSADEWAQGGTVDEVVDAMLSPTTSVRGAHSHADVARPRRPVVGVLTTAVIAAILVVAMVGDDLGRIAAMAGLVTLFVGRWGLVTWRGLTMKHMTHRSIVLLAVLAAAAVLGAPVAGRVQVPALDASSGLPVVIAGEMPVYPRVALAAKISGTVTLAVTTDGQRVASVDEISGPPMLSRASRDNIVTWEFAPHPPQRFVTTFTYEMVGSSCELRNSSIVADLPTKVAVTTPVVTYCDPSAVRQLNR